MCAPIVKNLKNEVNFTSCLSLQIDELQELDQRQPDDTCLS